MKYKVFRETYCAVERRISGEKGVVGFSNVSNSVVRGM